MDIIIYSFLFYRKNSSYEECTETENISKQIDNTVLLGQIILTKT